jgi:hypothetical protein
VIQPATEPVFMTNAPCHWNSPAGGGEVNTLAVALPLELAMILLPYMD